MFAVGTLLPTGHPEDAMVKPTASPALTWSRLTTGDSGEDAELSEAEDTYDWRAPSLLARCSRHLRAPPTSPRQPGTFATGTLFPTGHPEDAMVKPPGAHEIDMCTTAGPSPALNWSQVTTDDSEEDMQCGDLPEAAENNKSSDGRDLRSECESAGSDSEGGSGSEGTGRRPQRPHHPPLVFGPDFEQESSDEEDGAYFVLAVRRWAMHNCIQV